MGWKFWQKDQPAAKDTGAKTHKLGRPRDLPQEVGRHLVVEQGLDPDWAWSLKCVVKPRENSKSTFDVRVFSSESAVRQGVTVRDYTSLEDHADLILFAGWYDKETRQAQLDRPMKEAV